MFRTRQIGTLSSVTVLAMLSSVEWTQTACGQTTSPTSQAGPATEASALEEIVVTAQRRPERLQEAAFSGTALLGSALLETGRTTVAAALVDVPAVRVEGSSNGGQIFIRGVGSNADSQLGDPAVNFNIDGVYQQETEAVTNAIFDVNRVEVLRGPQGTLYGRNATAGAVNVITNDPVPNEMKGFFNAEFGNYAALKTEAAANLPITDELTLRAAETSQRHDGYLSNGNDNENSAGGRLKLLYTPTEALRILLSGDYLHLSDNDFGSVEAPLSQSDPWSSNKPRGYRDMYLWNAHTQIDYTLDWTALTLIAGHNAFNKDESNVLLGLAPAVADHRDGGQDSVELRAASMADSTVKWVGGFYYLSDEEVRRVIPSLISVPAVPATNPELQNAGIESYAVLANVTVPVFDHVRLDGGVRYTNDSKSAQYVYIDGSHTPDVLANKTWSSVTYKGEIEADLAEHSLLYAQVSTGFKAGGYAQQYPPAAYNPEKLTAYELGSKNDFASQGLRINGSLFYYDYKDYQASYPDIVAGTFALVTSNAATATVYGGELESTYRLTPSDTLSASLSYIHSKFGRFTYTSVLTGPVDHSNQPLPNSPLFSANLSYEHIFDLAHGATLTAMLQTHITQGYWTSVEHTPDSYQPAFTRTDAYLTYMPESENWNVRVFVNNLEGTAVRTLGLANPFDSVLLLAPPRTFGAGLTVKF